MKRTVTIPLSEYENLNQIKKQLDENTMAFAKDEIARGYFINTPTI